MTEYASGGIIPRPEGTDPSDSILTLGEREQVIDQHGRISCVYGGQLYRIANKQAAMPSLALLKAINDGHDTPKA